LSSLLVTHGHHFGVRYSLLDRTTLGRSSGCTIQLLDEKVSRLHTTIHRDGGRYIVKDEGSSNGTGLNGRLLLESKELQPGDEIAIGNNLMLFEPDLEILHDLAGAGTVVLATPPEASSGAVESPTGDDGFRIEGLMSALAELLASARGIGRPAALLEAAARSIGAERAALLLAPTGGEPMKAVATYPHRGRVAIAKPLIKRVLDERRAVRRPGALELTVRQGRSFIEHRGGSALCLPIVRGGRLRGAFYADSTAANAFSSLPLDDVFSALNLAFAPLFTGQPDLLVPRPDAETSEEHKLESPASLQVAEQARAAADISSPVLLHGEPGSGREHHARRIHSMSPRAPGPFVAFHCGAFARDIAEGIIFGLSKVADGGRAGLVEAANGGTLFLDDLGELPPHLQVKLLRMLQEGRIYRVGATRSVRVDVRVIAGSTRDLDTLVRGGVLRSDLVDHIAVTVIELPPLRRRLADIAPLVAQFVDEFELEHGPLTRGFTPEALGLLETQEWPGNVRELKDVVRRVLIRARGERVDGDDVRSELKALPSRSAFEKPEDLSPVVQRLEIELASRALGRCRGSRSRAARLLGVPVAELERRMAAWDIDPFGN